MANFNEQIRWTSSTPPIYVTVTYGKYRSGADMVYSVGLSISSVTGQRYFGYPIYAQIYVNGEGNPRYSITLKNASPSQWSNTIEYSTGNFTVSNKTTGTTGLAVRLYSGSGSSRDETYYFDMGVDPAYFTSTPTLTLKSKTETSITYNWRTSETCDRITWTGSGTKSTTGLPGTSGTVTFSGLTADTSYSHYGTFRRQDSQLETSSTTYTNSTDNYPYVASLSPNIITLGQTALQTINIFNPHSRQTTVYVKKSLNDSDADALATATTTGTSVSITIDASELYPEIPNSQSGTLYYYCKYSSHTTTSITGTYQINGSEKPIFPTSSWSYVADLTALTNNNQIVIDNYSTITLTVNTPATSDYNASITGYYATWGNATPVSFNGTSSVQLVKGNGTSLVVLANDSRELQSVLSSSTLDMTNNRVLYNKPVINTLETHRLNGIDTTVLLNATGTMFKGTFGANGIQNDIHHIYYYVKAIDSSTWSQAYSISLNDCTFDSTTGEWTISNASIHLNGTSGGFPSGTSYNVKLEFYDAQGLLGYGTATSTIEDGTLARDVFKDSDGEYHEGINGLADDDYTQTIHGSINIIGRIFVNGVEFVGGGESAPIGAIAGYPSSTPPNGWLICDGSAVSRTTYADLFAVIGTSHGAGNGSTTFNLPNMSSNTMVGVDPNDTKFNAVGKTYGEKTHKLTANEIPKFAFRTAHTAYGDAMSDGITNVTHTMLSSQGSSNTWWEGAKGDGKGYAERFDFGNDQAHNNIQPSIAEYYIIKAFEVTSTPPTSSVKNSETNTTTDVYSCDYINKCNTYSTSERFTGKYWVDGKKIYSKVYIYSGSTQNQITWTLGISDLSIVTQSYGMARMNDGGIFLPLTFYNNSSGWKSYHIRPSQNDILYQSAESYTTNYIHIVVEYTKTTD